MGSVGGVNSAQSWLPGSLSSMRPPRLVEMSRACLYSELASPLRGNKAHAHAEPVWGGGVETGNAAFLFGFQIGTQKEES